MSTKRIIDLDDSSQLGLSDYLAVYNSEPIADHATFKRTIGDVLALKSISVNGKTGSTITLNADDISDTITTKKFITATEKSKLGLIKNDLGSNVYLSGDGSYKTVGVTPQFVEVFMFNYLFFFPNRKYSLWNSKGSLHATVPTGTTVSGDTRFFWRVNPIDTIVPESLKIYDVNNDTYIADGITINNKEANGAGEVYVKLDPITHLVNSSHSWKIEFTTTGGLTIQSPELTFDWVE